MANFTFYNPSVLAASPDVAVNPAPISDSSALGLALLDGMKSVRDTVQREREIRSLRRETDALADYVAKDSPQLEQFLRNKATNYDMFTTDPSKERSGLMTGVMGLLDTESRRIRAEKDANTARVENVWKYKLQGADRRYEALLRDRQRWEEREEERIRAINSNRARMAANNVVTAPPVRGTYPRQAELDEAEKRSIALAEAGPEEVAAMGVPGQVLIPGQKAPSSLNYEPQPIPLPEEGYDPNEPSLLPKGLLDPGSLEASPEPPQLTEPPLQPTDNSPLNSSSPSLASPDVAMDDITRQALENRKFAEETKKLYIDSVDDIAARYERISRNIANKEALAALIAKKDSIKSQINSLPNVGSKLWDAQVKRILESYESDFRAIPDRTAVQQQTFEEKQNRVSVDFTVSGDTSGKTYPGYWVQVGNERIYYNSSGKNITTSVERKELIPHDPKSKGVNTEPAPAATPIPAPPTPTPAPTRMPELDNATTPLAPKNNPIILDNSTPPPTDMGELVDWLRRNK